jgi:hypothetical protein
VNLHNTENNCECFSKQTIASPLCIQLELRSDIFVCKLNQTISILNRFTIAIHLSYYIFLLYYKKIKGSSLAQGSDVAWKGWDQFSLSEVFFDDPFRITKGLSFPGKLTLFEPSLCFRPVSGLVNVLHSCLKI